MNDSPQNTQKDADLVLQTLKDKDNFALLIERYEKKLFRYIKRFTGLSNECSEDVLQEVFIKIYKNLNNYDPDLSFSSWAYRITHNEAINYLRKNKGNETIAIETDDPDVVNLIDILEDDTDIHKETEQKELAEKVHKLLYRLPAKYRDVMVLYYLEEKNYSEISDILKKPMGTVATLLNRAKSKFRKIAKKNNLTSLT
jgi:RNA polymerase sigma-70 factor (ECF subfamily)